MALRIKNQWFREGRSREPGELATAIAATIWKTANHGLQGVRKARFTVDVGAPFVNVLTEFLIFLVTAADRLAYRHDQGEWREAFTPALARRVAELYQDSLDDLVGPAPGAGHKGRFIDLLNQRMGEYADFEYRDDGPEFGFSRYFGSCVEAALTDEADRIWALDQIMTVQAPEAIEVLERAMRGVLGLEPRGRRRSSTSGD